jgi:hypothetical protein
VRADYFIGCIAFNSLRAGIPRCDYAVRIEMEDRVVNDPFDKLSKSRFRFQEALLGFTPLSDIPCYFDGAKQFTILISNGIKDGKRPELRTVLAKTPAFGFELTVPCGNIQRNFRSALLSILWRKKWEKGCPMTSLSSYPFRRRAPGFQLTM